MSLNSFDKFVTTAKNVISKTKDSYFSNEKLDNPLVYVEIYSFFDNTAFQSILLRSELSQSNFFERDTQAKGKAKLLLKCFSDLNTNETETYVYKGKKYFEQRRLTDFDTNMYKTKNISVIGLQAERASVYGEVLEISFSDYENELYKILSTYNLINVWIITDDILKRFKNIINNNETIDQYIKANIPLTFSGFILNIQKNVSNISKTNIYAQDMLRLFQHLMIPKVNRFIPFKLDKDIIKDNFIDGTTILTDPNQTSFSSLISFFGKAVMHNIQKSHIYEPTSEMKKSKYTAKLISKDDLKFHYFHIERNDFIEEKLSPNKIYVSSIIGNTMILKIHPFLLLYYVYKYFLDLIGLTKFFDPEIVKRSEFLNVIKKINEQSFNNQNNISVIGKNTDEIISIENYITIGIVSEENYNYENVNWNVNNIIKFIKKAFTFFVINDENKWWFVNSNENVVSVLDLGIYSFDIFTAMGTVSNNNQIKYLFYRNTLDDNKAEVLNDVYHYYKMYFMQLIYDDFKNSYNLYNLILDNNYFVKSTKFTASEKYVTTPVIKNGLSIIYILKALIFASFGITEKYIKIKENDYFSDTTIFSKIRNNIFLKINPTYTITAPRWKLSLFINFYEVNDIIKKITDYYFYSSKSKLKSIKNFTKTISLNEINNFETNQIRRDDIRFLFQDKNINFFIDNNKEISYLGSENTFVLEELISQSDIPIKLNNINNGLYPLYPVIIPSKPFSGGYGKEFLHTDNSGSGYYLFFPLKLENYSQVIKDTKRELKVIPCKFSSKDEEIFSFSKKSEIKDKTNYLIDVYEKNPLSNDKHLIKKYCLTSIFKYVDITKIINDLRSIFKYDEINYISRFITITFKFPEFDLTQNNSVQNVNLNNLNLTNSLKSEDFYKRLIKLLSEKDIGNYNYKNGYYTFKMTIGTFIEQVIDFITKPFDNFKGNYEKIWSSRLFLDGIVYRLNLDRETQLHYDLNNYRRIYFNWLDNKYVIADSDVILVSLDSTVRDFTTSFLKTLVVIYKLFIKINTQIDLHNSVIGSLYVSANNDIEVGDKLIIKNNENVINKIIEKFNNNKLQRISSVDMSFNNPRIFTNIGENKEFDQLEVYIWKRIIYVGNSGGTSGFTKKIYFTNNPFSWNINYEEENIITTLASALQRRYGLFEENL